MSLSSLPWRQTLLAVTVTAACAAQPVQAAMAVGYENLPTNLGGEHMESHHGVGGPILADDFISVLGGTIRRIEWWGSAAQDGRWELAFHTNWRGQPNIDNPVEGAFLKLGEDGSLFALGVADDPNHPDIFHYTANIAGPHILAGVEYWFTVANFAAGWQWAQALNGPTVGWENFNVHRSTGIGPCADGGPHCGPWVDTHTDTAFRFTVPEPGSLALVGLTGLMALGLRTRRREPTEASEALPA